jgi:hypothetical protein
LAGGILLWTTAPRNPSHVAVTLRRIATGVEF